MQTSDFTKELDKVMENHKKDYVIKTKYSINNSGLPRSKQIKNSNKNNSNSIKVKNISKCDNKGVDQFFEKLKETLSGKNTGISTNLDKNKVQENMSLKEKPESIFNRKHRVQDNNENPSNGSKKYCTHHNDNKQSVTSETPARLSKIAPSIADASKPSLKQNLKTTIETLQSLVTEHQIGLVYADKIEEVLQLINKSAEFSFEECHDGKTQLVIKSRLSLADVFGDGFYDAIYGHFKGDGVVKGKCVIVYVISI